jgi:WD40 repeat protein
MWNTRLGVRVLHQPWHSGNIYDVAFSPDGKLFASTNRDGTVAVRRVPDFTLVKELRLVTDSRRVVFADARMLATLPHDGESPLRDTAQDFHRAASWNVGVGNSRALGVSPDGRQVVCAVRNADPRAWYVRGQAEARLSAGGATTAFGFRPDGARFAAARDDHVMRPVRPPGGGAGSRVQPGRPPRGHRLRRPPGSNVWDAATGQLRHPLPGHRAGVAALAFRPGTTELVTADDGGEVRFWDAFAGKDRTVHDTRPVTGDPDEARPTAKAGASLAFTPDGTRVALGSAALSVQVWDADTRRPLLDLDAIPGGGRQCVAFTPVGSGPSPLAASPPCNGSRSPLDTTPRIGHHAGVAPGAVRCASYQPSRQRSSPRCSP